MIEMSRSPGPSDATMPGADGAAGLTKRSDLPGRCGRTHGWLAQAGHTVRAFAWSVGAALEIDHDPPLDFTVMHAREDVVDVLEFVG